MDALCVCVQIHTPMSIGCALPVTHSPLCSVIVDRVAMAVLNIETLLAVSMKRRHRILPVLPVLAVVAEIVRRGAVLAGPPAQRCHPGVHCYYRRQ